MTPRRYGYYTARPWVVHGANLYASNGKLVIGEFSRVADRKLGAAAPLLLEVAARLVILAAAAIRGGAEVGTLTEIVAARAAQATAEALGRRGRPEFFEVDIALSNGDAAGAQGLERLRRLILAEATDLEQAAGTLP